MDFLNTFYQDEEFPPFISGGLGQFEKTEKCDDHWFQGHWF